MSPQFVRRSSRIPKQLAILLIGSDIEGKVFSEESKTVVLSQHGAGILSSYKLAPEQEVIIRRLDTQKEADVRVVGQIGAESDTYTYGVAFLDPSIDLWGVEFPAMSESDKQAGRMLLECSRCKSREYLGEGDMESDVFAINEGLVHYCRRCGSSTLWRQPSGGAEGEPVLPEAQRHSEPVPATDSIDPATVNPVAPQESAPAPVPESTPAPHPPEPVENRRKHRRTKVSFQACIRRAGHQDEVVACEDMSRGGLRFKSRQSYDRGSMIEVAVPYAPGETAIFVTAKIVYMQELPEEKRFRCGVAYVKGGGSQYG
jgi:hypothetical protein